MPKQQASVLRYCSSLQILLFYMYYTDQEAEKAILVGVALQSEGITYEQMTEYLDELSFLAETAGAETVKIFTQNLHATFIGKGKLEEIKAYTEENPVDMVIFDDELSPTQLRNIESVFPGIKVLDRTNLILDIFASRARTAHAKTQVELAQYQYLLPRLTGMWTHLERQKGGLGLRGPGETEIETDRRIIRDKISRLKNELTKIDKQKVIQRKNRGKLVRVALVGYTNVGKSTLMNLLSKSDVFAENKLFATLDTTVRKIAIKNVPFLLADTVGFIRKLPHHLVESFKSTLDEVREADVILHVVDISHPQFEDQMKVVSQGQFITSVFFRNPEQGLPAIPRTHKTDRFTGIFFYGSSNRTMYKLYSQLFTKLPYILTVDFVSDIFHSNMSSHNRIILFRITGPQCQYFQ